MIEIKEEKENAGQVSEETVSSTENIEKSEDNKLSENVSEEQNENIQVCPEEPVSLDEEVKKSTEEGPETERARFISEYNKKVREERRKKRQKSAWITYTVGYVALLLFFVMLGVIALSSCKIAGSLERISRDVNDIRSDGARSAKPLKEIDEHLIDIAGVIRDAHEYREEQGRDLPVALNNEEEHGWLGVLIKNATATNGNDNIHGPAIVNVVPGSGAEKAGLMVNDLITSANGIVVTDVQSLLNVLESTKPGQTIELTYIRDKAYKESETTVILSEKPEEPEEGFKVWYEPEEEGRWVEITPEQDKSSKDLGLHCEDGHVDKFDGIVDGAEVVYVEYDSPADYSGLMEGDLITAVNGWEINSAVEMDRRIADDASQNEVTLTVIRTYQGDSSEIDVTVPFK